MKNRDSRYEELYVKLIGKFNVENINERMDKILMKSYYYNYFNEDFSSVLKEELFHIFSNSEVYTALSPFGNHGSWVNVLYLISNYNLEANFQNELEQIFKYLNLSLTEQRKYIENSNGKIPNYFYDVINGTASYGRYLIKFRLSSEETTIYINYLEELLDALLFQTNDVVIDFSPSHGLIATIINYLVIKRALKMDKTKIDERLRYFFNNCLACSKGIPAFIKQETHKNVVIESCNQYGWCYGKAGIIDSINTLFSTAYKLEENYRNINCNDIKYLEELSFCHGIAGDVLILFNHKKLTHIQKLVEILERYIINMDFNLEFENNRDRYVYIKDEKMMNTKFLSSIDGLSSIFIILLILNSKNKMDIYNDLMCLNGGDFHGKI